MSQPTGPHCESCGATDYESLYTGDQGYTACCNERVCSGGYDERWVIGTYRDRDDVLGVPSGFVHACCAATARPKAEAQNKRVLYRAS